MSVAEKYYSVAEVALLLSCSADTVKRRIKSGKLGLGVVNIGEDGKGADWRVPASGLNAYLQARRLFNEAEPGVTARSIGELRRKARV
jgi:excisionase family DNA binding protein